MSSGSQISISERQSDVQPPANHDWYALQTRARFERKICRQVEGKGHEAYVPVTRERRRWSDRSQTIELPLFPGYVFVRSVFEPADRLAVLQTSGAYGFVSFQGVIARIPDRQIKDLQLVESQNAVCCAYPFLKNGQRVRICGGSLEGLEGILVNERGGKLVISIEPMQRSIAIDLTGYHVEAI